MLKLHSEHIGKRLLISMLVIVLSLLCISIPLIIGAYRDYQQSKHTLVELKALTTVADLANRISRERGPSNMAMSSTAEDLNKNLEDLKQYRKGVDEQIELTFATLQNAGFKQLAKELKFEIQNKLTLARQHVDKYIETPFQQRQSSQLDTAIVSMFGAWDSCHELLKNVVMQSQSKDGGISDYYTLVMILAELRDQAGRVASNVMASVTFHEPIPNENIARALQTQKQVRYLWDLVNTMQHEQNKTPEFNHLYVNVKRQFIDLGLPIVTQLIEQSHAGEAYFLTGTQLTAEISPKFTTVIDLQKYLLEYSVEAAEREQSAAQRKFLSNLLIALVSLMAALFTMIYAQRKVFYPLIQARDTIVELSYAHSSAGSDVVEHKLRQVHSLYDALQKLQDMLKQRDAFEFELKSIANTDRLTGVSNRLALDEYLKLTEKLPNHFENICLIIIDIDNFKQVNDTHGHIFGDNVIVAVADCLKENVRHSDLIIRFGGDEFLVVMQNIEFDKAVASAEKIRTAVASLDLIDPENKEKLNISVSIGVAVGARTWMDLLEKADKSLFKSKEGGKNLVSV